MRFKSVFEIDSQDPVSNSAGHPRYEKQRKILSTAQAPIQYMVNYL